MDNNSPCGNISEERIAGRGFFRLLIILVIFAVAGCQTASVRHDPGDAYPASRYLTARGTGQSEQEARNQAVAELSRIFESRVYSDTMDRIKSVVDSSGSEISEQSIESTIRVVSAMELKGVEIGKTWLDREKNVHYALAVLDRLRAREEWMSEVADIDASIEGEFNVYREAPGRFGRYRALRRILGLWIKRESVVSRLRVLGFGRDARPSYEIKEVLSGIPRLRSRMKVHVVFRGPRAGEVAGRTSSVLSSAGYLLVDDRSAADVVVEGSVRVVPVDLRNPGWEFARALVSAVVMDTATGDTVGEVSLKARAGHLTYEEAVHRAVRKVAAPVAERIMEYFEK